LPNWAETAEVGAGSFAVVRAFEAATPGYYHLQEQRYQDVPVRKQSRCSPSPGDIRCGRTGVEVHAHVVCGWRDGSTVGGHVQEARVRPTLEVMVTRARLARSAAGTTTARAWL
jgi:predicted DNA-binding protein with PD1-like motif